MDSYIILLNKERGISSNSAVNRVKYAVGANKAGHLGTLDVLATGLLPITINKATKQLFAYIIVMKKMVNNEDVWNTFVSKIVCLEKKYPFVRLDYFGFTKEWKKFLTSPRIKNIIAS